MKGCVYIIRSHQTDDVYYGCTMQMLCKRMATHRACYKRWLNGNSHYVSSYDILKYDDAYIELVEEVEFMNKAILYAREGHYIRENKCVNKNIAGRTEKQYYQDNKDHVAETKKNWYENHKTEIVEKTKQYYEDNKDDILERHKQYYEAHRNKILENCKKYRDANQDKIIKYLEANKEHKKQYDKENRAKINERRRKRRAEKRAAN